MRVNFFSLDRHRKFEAVDHFWIEVEMDGWTFRLDFGKRDNTADLNSIHINCAGLVRVDQHSLNALDVYADKPCAT